MQGSVRGVAWQGFYVQGRRRHEATVFVIEVDDVLDNWPEKGIRQRKWVPVSVARHIAKHGWMSEALSAGFNLSV